MKVRDKKTWIMTSDVSDSYTLIHRRNYWVYVWSINGDEWFKDLYWRHLISNMVYLSIQYLI